MSENLIAHPPIPSYPAGPDLTAAELATLPRNERRMMCSCGMSVTAEPESAGIRADTIELWKQYHSGHGHAPVDFFTHRAGRYLRFPNLGNDNYVGLDWTA